MKVGSKCQHSNTVAMILSALYLPDNHPRCDIHKAVQRNGHLQGLLEGGNRAGISEASELQWHLMPMADHLQAKQWSNLPAIMYDVMACKHVKQRSQAAMYVLKQ